MSRAIFTDAGSWGGYTGTRVEYAASDLAGLTQLTIDGYARVDDFEVVGSTTGVPLIQHGRGIPGDTGFPLGSYGRAQLQVAVNSDGYFSVHTNTTLIGATASGGLITAGVAFHWMCTWDFGAAAGQEVKLYVNGVSAPIGAPQSPAAGLDQVDAYIDAFDNRANFPAGFKYSYYHGGVTVASVIKPCSVDYVRVWNGVTATSGQAAEYGGAYRVDSGTLGAPDHLWDFDGDCEDTGSSPLTLVSTREVTFDSEVMHPVPVPAVCSSLTFAQSIEAEDASWCVYATIEGCGTSDGLYRFCTTVPHFAEGNALFRPWLAAWPNILSEGAPKDDGGLVDAGELSLSILDLDDALTSEWRTEADPVTAMAEALVPGTTTFDVLDASSLTIGDVIYVASEAMVVDDVTGDTLIVTRGALDTQAVNIEAGAPVYPYLPYLLSRRIRAYVVSADSCEESEAQAIGEYRVDQKEIDDTLGVYTIRGPSQIIFANAQCSRRQPDRYKVKTAFASGKVVCQAQPRFQRYSSIPYWDVGTTPRVFLKVGDEISIAENVSLSVDQYPIFQLRERGVLGTVVEDVTSAESVEVVFGADPREYLSGSQPTFFRYSPGPSPSSDRTTGTWIASAHWVDILLNLLVGSTSPEDGLELANRTAAFGAWDCLPPGIGVGQRASAIDWASALSVRARTPDYLFANFVVPNEPITFGELVTEEFLHPIGAYLTTSGGLLRIVMPRIPAASDTSFTVGHADIASERVGPRLYGMGVRIAQDMSEVVTSIQYQLGRNDEADTLTINDADYDLTYGSKGYREHETRRRTIKVPSVRPDTDGSVEFLKNRGMATMARKRYPATTISYTTSGLKYFASTTGDVGEFTHGQVPDQSKGLRGVVGMQAELRQRTVKVEPDAVQIEHVLRVDKINSRMGLIAPCARVESVASGSGSNKIVTVSANFFTDAESADAGLPATDAAAFTVGDVLQRRYRDGSVVSGTTQTIVAISGNTITVDGDYGTTLTNGTGNAGSVLAYAEHSDSASQQTEVYVYTADNVTLDIDGSTDKPWRFSEV